MYLSFDVCSVFVVIECSVFILSEYFVLYALEKSMEWGVLYFSDLCCVKFHVCVVVSLLFKMNLVMVLGMQYVC